jgi:hemolysin activation/secretion protein
MKTTEVSQPSISSPGTAGAGATGSIAHSPLPEQVTLADRLKALGVVAVACGLGVGAVLLGRAIWQPADESFAPIAQEADSSTSQSLPLRDRVPVLKPGNVPTGAAAPLTLTPDNAARQARLRQQPQDAVPLVTHGFQNADPIASDPEAEQEESADDADAEAASETSEDSEAAVAQAPSDSSNQKAEQANAAVQAVIASLLRPRQPDHETTIATAPPPGAAIAIPSTTGSATSSEVPPETTPETPPPIRPIAPGIPTTAPTPGVTAVGTPEQPIETPPTSPASPAAPETAIAPSTPPLTPENSVYVERLSITGNTQFPPSQLNDLVRKTVLADAATLDTPPPALSDPTLLNRRLTPADLVRASEAITKLYIERGYINSGAYVPSEVLTGAVPEIRIIEGRIATINVNVKRPKFLWLARPLSRGYVRRRLARAIRAPLQIDQLVDAVKLMEQDPLIRSISTELAPGTSTGTSTLNVEVQQASPLQVTFGVDNGRSPSVGRFRQQASLIHYNLLGLGDWLRLGVNRSEGSRGFDFGYVIPLNARNGTLSFNYSRNRGEVIEEPFRELDIKSRSQNYEVSLRQPIKQSSTEELALTLRGIHYRNEGVFLESFNGGVAIPFPARGSDAEGITRVTALRFGQEWVKRSERNVMSLQSEFSLGVRALNATILDEPPDSRFFSWQGRGFWVQSFAPDTLLAVKGQVQLANRPLVPVEQFSIGGIDNVRGYRTGALLSDSGWYVSTELYLPILRVPKWQGVLQVIPFFDIGRGWNRGDEEPDPNRLMSTGLGVQWKMGDTFRARLDWGIPLINSTNSSGQSIKEGLFFSVTFSP